MTANVNVNVAGIVLAETQRVLSNMFSETMIMQHKTTP